MDDAHRWSVTYTNHVKQKRKVFHDGFLVLQPSPDKVMLYDEGDKLLETRFVKKDDIIKSGETVTFDSYLVDIGELCRGDEGTSVFNCQEKDMKVSEKSRPFSSYNSQNRKPLFGKSKGRVINLSPSHKVIRDFKKSEMNKFGSAPNCMDMTIASTREWQVLYTTQVTQKAKKFHDGFLELIVCGSQGRQVKLYDTNRRHLDSRFLKKNETVCSGESLSFEGHLVEIGEQEGDHKLITDITLTPQGKNCKIVGKTDLDHQAKFPTNKKFPAVMELKGHFSDRLSRGKSPDSTSQGKISKLSWENSGPRRAVNDILSILKQPIERKVVPMNKPSADTHLELHSSDSQSNSENHKQGYSKECSSKIEDQTHATCTRSKENEEPENEDIITDSNGAPINGLNCSKLPKVEEEAHANSSICHKAASCVSTVASNNCTSHDLSGVKEKINKQDDFPSFDLGF